MKKHHFLWKAMFIVFVCSTSFVHGQTLQQRQQIRKSYNLTKLERLQKDFQEKSTRRKAEALQRAAQEGWEIQKVNPDGTVDELMAVSEDGQPIYYTVFNVHAAHSTRTDHLNTGGSLGLNLDGQNMTAHVWDGGATRPTHQEFGGRVTINDGVTTPNGNSFHSQHVTGTIMAAGVNAGAKGMAPQAMALTHDWDNDLVEATAEAANGMLISNHSYGLRGDLLEDWIFGAYIPMSQDWDELMYNSPFYLMVQAAGNEGSITYNGDPLNGNAAFDKLSGVCTSKNNLVVANGNDANVNTNGALNSVVIYGTSSVGPTDDLRIKPDITGNGTAVFSTSNISDMGYRTMTGTSMASPNVAGTLLLLQQHFHNLNGNFMRAATLKGLALHTADDAGIPGPDAVYGWGLLNAKAAAETISQNGIASEIEELTLYSGQTYTFEVDADGVNPLMASISWTDPPGTAAYTYAPNLSTPVLVNDLDIRVIQGASTAQPFRLTDVNSNGTGDNNVDPYERVDVRGASGTYIVTVSNKGSLAGGRQDFTLIVTGGTIVTAELPACIATIPTGLNVFEVGSSTASLYWEPVPGTSYNLRYRETGTTSWITTGVTGPSITLDGLTPETSYEAQVSSKCPDESASVYSSSVSFNTTEDVVTYCSSNGNNNSFEYIHRVQIGSIDNTTGASSGGYGDFTSLSTDLTIGTIMDITITPTWTGRSFNEAYSVWIDYDQDGTFSSSEKVFTQPATMYVPVRGNFEVPATATPGNTRMRIAMRETQIPDDPCESFHWGEVEDYTVFIDTAKAPQTITFDAIPNKVYGDVFTLHATASSGLPVSFEIIAGQATLSGNEVTVTGHRSPTIRASQAGNEEYSPATSIDRVVQSGRAPLTVTADDQAITYGESLPELTVTYTGFVLGETIGDMQNGLILPDVTTTATAASDAGEYAIEVSGGASLYYELSYVNGTLVIAKADQTITFDPPTEINVSEGSLLLEATSSSGLDVSFSVISGPATLNGNTAILTGTGELVIEASQAGNANYNEASVSKTIHVIGVSKIYQSITFDAIPVKVYGDIFTLEASASSELPVNFEIISGPATLSGSDEVTVTGVGEVTVRASQGGDEEYNAALSKELVFRCIKAPLTVTADDQAITYGESLPELTVTYTGFVNGENAAILAIEPEVTTEATENSDAGSYAIALSEGPDDHYELTPVAGTLTINKALAKITLADLEQEADGSPKQPTVTTDPAGLAYKITFNGSISAPVVVGAYEVVVTTTETNYVGTMEATFNLTEIVVGHIDLPDGLKIYPNPANEHFEIKSFKDELFKVYDVGGKLQLVGMTNTKTAVSGLSNGVYIIELAGGSYLRLIKL